MRWCLWERAGADCEDEIASAAVSRLELGLLTAVEMIVTRRVLMDGRGAIICRLSILQRGESRQPTFYKSSVPF